MRIAVLLVGILVLVGCTQPPTASLAVLSDQLAGGRLQKYSNPRYVAELLSRFGFDCGGAGESFPLLCRGSDLTLLWVNISSHQLYLSIDRDQLWPGGLERAAEAIVAQLPSLKSAFADLSFQQPSLSSDRNRPLDFVGGFMDVKVSDFLK